MSHISSFYLQRETSNLQNSVLVLYLKEKIEKGEQYKHTIPGCGAVKNSKDTAAQGNHEVEITKEVPW